MGCLLRLLACVIGVVRYHPFGAVRASLVYFCVCVCVLVLRRACREPCLHLRCEGLFLPRVYRSWFCRHLAFVYIRVNPLRLTSRM